MHKTACLGGQEGEGGPQRLRTSHGVTSSAKCAQSAMHAAQTDGCDGRAGRLRAGVLLWWSDEVRRKLERGPARQHRQACHARHACTTRVLHVRSAGGHARLSAPHARGTTAPGAVPSFNTTRMARARMHACMHARGPARTTSAPGR